MPVRHFYLLSHYICDGLFFLFSVFWFQKEWIQHYICNYQPFSVSVFWLWNECNSLWENKGRRQMIMAYSDTVSTMQNLFSSFTDDKMIPQAITVHDKFTIILLQYITVLFWRYTFWVNSSLLTSPPYPSPKTIAFLPSGAKTQKKETISYLRCGFGAGLRCGWAA